MDSPDYVPFLSDQQWALIAPHLSRPKPSPRGGRPRANDRACLEGILYILKEGARWKSLPRCYPSYSTCWRRLKQWEEDGCWVAVWHALVSRLSEEELLEWDETFIDATFARGKKGVPPWVRQRAAKDQSLWWWQAATVYLWERLWSPPAPMRVVSP